MTDKTNKVEDEVGNDDHILLGLTVVLLAVVAVTDVTNSHTTRQTDAVGAPIVMTTDTIDHDNDHDHELSSATTVATPDMCGVTAANDNMTCDGHHHPHTNNITMTTAKTIIDKTTTNTHPQHHLTLTNNNNNKTYMPDSTTPDHKLRVFSKGGQF